MAIGRCFRLHPPRWAGEDRPAAAQQPWKPSRNVEIVEGSGAGGAADRQGRVVQKYLQAFPGIPSVTVSNRAGGGAATCAGSWSLGMRYVSG